jgi:hypothetical protein
MTGKLNKAPGAAQKQTKKQKKKKKKKTINRSENRFM